MKLLLISLLCIAAAYAKEADTVFKHLDLTKDRQDDAATATTKCLEETQVDPDLIKKTEEGIFIDDKNLKCYYSCLSKKFGTMDEQGNFNNEKIFSISSGQKREYLELCLKQIESTDHCDKAFDAYKCFRRRLLKSEANVKP